MYTLSIYYDGTSDKNIIVQAISNIAKVRGDKEVRNKSIQFNKRYDMISNFSPSLQLKKFFICPYVITLDVYSDLQKIEPQVKSQIFARYGYFASILLALDMKREACVALCHAANYLLSELLQTNDSSNFLCGILLFSDEFYNGKMKKALFQNRHLTQYLTKLAQIYISILNEPYETKVSDHVRGILQKSSLGSKMLRVSEWRDAALLANIVGEFTGASPRHLVLLNELLAVIQMSSSLKLLQDKGHKDFQRDFDNSILLIVKSLKKSAVDIPALYFAAASIMYSLGRTSAFQTYEIRATYYIDRAYDEVNIYSQHQQVDVVKIVESLTYKASILLLKHHLHTKGSFLNNELEVVMEQCNDALELIYKEPDEELRSIMSKRFGKCLLWLVVRIYQHYSCDNACASGSEKMTLIYDYTCHTQKRTGFECIAVPLLVKGELLNEAKYLVSLMESVGNEEEKVPDNHEKTSEISKRILAVVKSNDDIDELVIKITSFAFEIESSTLSFDTLHDLEEGFYLFKSFFAKISSADTEGLTTTSQKMALSISAMWWMSTCQAILSQGFYKVGAMKRALKSIRLSIDFCKQGLSFCKHPQGLILPHLNDFKGNSFTTMFIASNRLRTLFKARINDSYEHIAKIYIIIGDHKRAKRYVIASGENLSLIPKNIPLSNGGSVEDMLKILNPKVHCTRHMTMKNTMLDIFSLSAPKTSNISGVLSFFVKDISDTMKIQLERQSLDWLRESIQYFLHCK